MKSNIFTRFSKKEKVVVIILLALLAAAAVLSSVRFSQRFSYKSSLAELGIPPELSDNGTYPENIVIDGKAYSYNKDVVSILFIGNDKTDQREKEGMGYQADTLLLGAFNRKTGGLTIINIPRDTLADVAAFDASGNFVYLKPSQIALAHAYAEEDLKLGADLEMAAVSNLLDNVPITRYVAMDIDGIGPITEAMGGVELELKAGFGMFNPSMDKGQVYNLKGDEAELYVRSRQIPGMSGKNSERMKLQVHFATEFIKTLKVRLKENPLIVIDLLKAASGHVQTNLTLWEIIEIVSKLKDVSLSAEDIIRLPGHTNRYEGIEQSVYIPDEEELQPLILETYFVPVE